MERKKVVDLIQNQTQTVALQEISTSEKPQKQLFSTIFARSGNDRIRNSSSKEYVQEVVTAIQKESRFERYIDRIVLTFVANEAKRLAGCGCWNCTVSRDSLIYWYRS